MALTFFDPAMAVGDSMINAELGRQQQKAKNG
jgi:hypothetical protein